MKYFIDTEFIEDFTRPLIGKSRHYIDLISIAIVAEDGREYYAVSNEFDINHVWNKYQIKTWMPENSINPNERCGQIIEKKEYWLRDNVLMPIVHELAKRDYDENGWYFADFGSPGNWLSFIKQSPSWERTWKPRAKTLIRKFGKCNKQIAQEIEQFCSGKTGRLEWADASKEKVEFIDDPAGPVEVNHGSPEFYGYYADYDWVLFCSLYGRMLDLPKGFPMYCRDLKQIFDDVELRYVNSPRRIEPSKYETRRPTGEYYKSVKDFPEYPKQINSHNALDDARWNKKLYDFLQTV